MASTLISALDVGLQPDLDDDHSNTLHMAAPVMSLSSQSHRPQSPSTTPLLLLQPQEQETGDSAQKEASEDTVNCSSRSVPIPSEVVLHIFRFLTAPQDVRAAILVCKQWCLCGVEMLWSRPAMVNMSVAERIGKTLSIGGVVTGEGALVQDQEQESTESHPHEQSVDSMTTPTNTTSTAMTTTVFPYRDYIRRLNFSFLGQELTDGSLVQFATCSRLERLLLPGCINATEEGLKEILKVGHSLYSLDLSGIPAVTDAVLEHVAAHCPKLHTLYLAGCTALTDESLIKLAFGCASLKRVC
jgi:hypothetical protein